jgi:dolichol-phosphate mannosyltransferase
MSDASSNAARPDLPAISVVAPVYNERETIDAFVERTLAALDRVQGAEAKLILVDDGSADGSAARILELRERDPRIALVTLSRNFGHQAALSAGLDAATGDAVILIDADLQDPPEVIPEMVESWRGGADVVLAERRSRRDTGLRRAGFALFHRFFRFVTDFPIPADTGIFGLLDRRAADELRRLSERNRFLPGLRSWIGFRTATVEYDRAERAAGEPKQTLRRLVRYAMDGVLSFSYKPLRLMTWAGALVSLAGFSLASYFIAKRLLGIETADTGFTTLVTLILFMGGLQLLALGLVSEYIARIYDEVKNRPLYIVGATHGLGEEPSRLEPTVRRARPARTPEPAGP